LHGQAVVAWAGGELIELNGTEAAGYDAPSGRWRRLSDPPFPVDGTVAVSAWTGRQLVVADGPRVALYDPAANRWTAPASPLGGLDADAVAWTGREVVLASVAGWGSDGKLGVAGYDPATGRWRVITPALSAGQQARFAALVAVPKRLLTWVLWDQRLGRGGLGSGIDVLALGPGSTGSVWRNVTGNWPQHRVVTSPVFTGSSILLSPGEIWCGSACSPPYSPGQGYLVDPVTLRETAISLGPLGQTNPFLVWASGAVIAVNLDASVSGPGVSIHPGEMARWVSGQWSLLPGLPGNPPLAAVPVWTGSRLLALAANGQLYASHQ
jgi:hypothetical protein